MKKFSKFCGLALMAMLPLTSISTSSNKSSFATDEPSVAIKYANLAFEDNVYLLYAVKAENNTSDPNLYVWKMDEIKDGKGKDFDKERATKLDHFSYGKLPGQEADQNDYYLFAYTKVSAKEMSDDVYAIASVDGVDSKLVKYSVMEYARKYISAPQGTYDAKFITFLQKMLDYGAAAQTMFDYRTDHLATDNYYKVYGKGFTINSDKSDHAFVKAGATLKLNSADGKDKVWVVNGTIDSFDKMYITLNNINSDTEVLVYDMTTVTIKYPNSMTIKDELNNVIENNSMQNIQVGVDVIVDGNSIKIGQKTYTASFNENIIASVDWGTVPSKVDKNFTLNVQVGYSAKALLNNTDHVLTFKYDRTIYENSDTLSVYDIPAYYDNGTDGTGIDPKWGWKGNTTITSVVIDESFANFNGVTTCNSFFYNLSNVTSITGLEYFNTSKSTSFKNMFAGCSSLVNLDVSNFNSTACRNMQYVFSGCSKLETLYIFNFTNKDSVNVTGFFGNCSSLTTIYQKTGYLFRNYYNDSSLFSSCKSLKGGNGTVYSSDHQSGAYARVDTAETKGYFTAYTN